jgi:hypothetical protein
LVEAVEQRPLEERIREALEGLQHSHVEISQTTRGATFAVKVRDSDPFEAARKALELYRKLKEELGI